MREHRPYAAYRKPLRLVPSVGDEDWLYTVSPSQILAELQTVDQAADALSRDVDRSKVSDAFRTEFATFKDSWKKYFQDNQGLMSRLSIKDYRKALEWRDRVDQWRASFIQAGGQVTGPGLPENPGHKSPFAMSSKVVIGGIVALGALWFISGMLPRRAAREATQ